MLQVEAAGSRVEAELARILNAAMGAWQASSSLAALKPKAHYDSVNVAVWLKAIARSPVSLIRTPPHISLHNLIFNLCTCLTCSAIHSSIEYTLVIQCGEHFDA